MKMNKFLSLLIAFGLVAVSFSLTSAQDASEIMKKSHLAYYYAADDGVAEVTMVLVDKKGKEREREFTMLRLDNEEGGKQKYYTYFKKPSDVARISFMVHKEPDANDLRWIYVPSVDLIKPISADDKNSSFVGSDFTYEDVSGRHWSEDNHTLTGESDLNGTPVYVIESVPKEDFSSFDKKISYIAKDTFLPLKEEYYKKDKLVRIFTADKIEVIDDIPTVTVRKMDNVKKGSHTFVNFNDISYNAGLTDDLFTERYLKSPPRKFVK